MNVKNDNNSSNKEECEEEKEDEHQEEELEEVPTRPPTQLDTNRQMETALSDANESVYDMDAYEAEKELSNEDFINKVQNNDIQLIRETTIWKAKYKLDENDNSKGANEMLEGNIDLDKEGLDEDQKAEVVDERQSMAERSLTEIFDGIGSH